MARNYIKLKQLEPSGLASLVRTSNTGDFLTTGYSGHVSSTFYPRSNPSGYVRSTETGNLAGTGGSGWVGANYVAKSESGLFYPASNPSGYVASSATGILASAGTGSAVGTGWVNANFYPRSNPSGFKAPIIIVSTGQPPSGEFDETGNLWLDTTGDCKPVLKAYDRCSQEWSPVTTLGRLTQVVFDPLVDPTDYGYYTFVDIVDSDTVTMGVDGHPNAAIYYTYSSGSTVSGISVSTPTTGSSRYTSPLELVNTGTGEAYYLVKAKAFLSYYNSSQVSTGYYRINARYPKVVFSPHNGYPTTDLTSVTLSVPDHSGAAMIYYTITTGTRDFIETGSHTAPTITSYTNTGTAPLSINVSSYQNVSYNIKAFAAALPSDSEGKRRSIVSSSSYASKLGGAYGQNPSLEGINFSPDTIQEGAGSVGFPVQCVPSMISHSIEDGLAFYYKTDGSEPSISNYEIFHSGSANPYILLDGDSASDNDVIIKVFATKYGYEPTEVTTGSYVRKSVVLTPQSDTEVRFGNYTGFTMQGYNHIFYTTGDSSLGTVPNPSANACDLTYSAPTKKYSGEFFFPANTVNATIKYFALATSGCASNIIFRTGNYTRRRAAQANLSLGNGSRISGNNCESIILSSADIDVDFYVTSGTSTPADPTTSSYKVTGSNYSGDCCANMSGTGVFSVCPGYTYKFLVSGSGLRASNIVTSSYAYYYSDSANISFSPSATTQDFSGTNITVNITSGYSGFLVTGVTTTIQDPKVTGDSNLENWTVSGSNPAFAVLSGDTIALPLNSVTSAQTFKIKAIAVLDGRQPSQTVKSKNYNKKIAASISFDPPNGIISAIGEQVTLSSTDSSPIEYYIETGNPTAATPTTSSLRYFADYSETLSLNPNDQIKAFAWRSGLQASAVQTVTYQIGQAENEITITPTNNSQIRFGFSDIEFSIPANASGYYTTGIGAAPEDPKVTGNGTYSIFNVSGANSAQAYTSSFVIPYTAESEQETGYVKYIMVTGGYQPSDVITISYTKRAANAPTLNPANGAQVNATGEDILITSSDLFVDFYINSGDTLDEVANPTTGSSGYVRDFASSFKVYPNKDIRVITWGSGLTPSVVTSADYDYITQENDLIFTPETGDLIDFASSNLNIQSPTNNALIYVATGSGLTLNDPVITGNSDYSAFGISGGSAFLFTSAIDIPDSAYTFRVKAVAVSTGKLVSPIASRVYGNTVSPVISSQSVTPVTPAYPNGSYDLVSGETFTFKVTGFAGLSPDIEWYVSGSAGEQQIVNGGNYTITNTTPTDQLTYSVLQVRGNSNTRPTFYSKVSNTYGTVTGSQTTVKFYSSRIANPVVVVPSGGRIANNGAFLDITTQTGSSSNALTFVKLQRGVSLASLADPNGNVSWENSYYSSPYTIYNNTVNKLWSSGDGVARTNVLGFSYKTGSQQNQNFFSPVSGLYYNYIDVNIPSGGFEIYTTNGFVTPQLGLIYNSGVTGSAISAPTTSSYSGSIPLTYDSGIRSYTGRFYLNGDFDFKTLLIESGSNYGANWTGEISTVFENRIKFAAVNFLKNLTWGTASVGEANQSKLIGSDITINSVDPVKVKEYNNSYLALDKNGDLWAYGLNSFYKLGTTYSTSSPIKVATNVKDFDISYNYSAIISGASNELLFAGFNSSEQIPYTASNVTYSTFTSVGITGIGKVALGDGDAHTMFVPSSSSSSFSSGCVYTCGYNGFGQLGRPTTSYADATPGLVSRFINANIKEISAGERHSAVLKKDGSLYLFGRNNVGQLGVVRTDDQFSSTTITPISTNATKVSLGGSHSAYIDINSKLWTFGSNYYNQVRPDTTSNQATPYNILNNIKDISLGELHTLVLSGSASNGSLYGFGRNYDGQIKTPASAKVTTPHLMASDIDSGDFTASRATSHYLYPGSGYGFSNSDDNNLAILNYVTGANGLATGANTIAIQLQSLGSERLINAAVKYSIDGTDPATGKFAYVIGAGKTGNISGVTNLFFLPETGLNVYSTGAGDLTLRYIAYSTGSSTGDIGNSASTTTIIERKTLSPQIKVTYYDDILDTARAVSGYNETGFSDSFNRNATVDINFANYDSDSVASLKFYKNGTLQSTNKTGVRTYEVATSDTNVGTITFSGRASGYKITGADITGIFQRHQLFSGSISAETPSGTKYVQVIYRVEINNNSANPSDSIIKYTTNGTEPNKNSTSYTGPISLTPGSTYTIRHKVYKNGYLISAEGHSGVYTVIEQS